MPVIQVTTARREASQDADPLTLIVNGNSYRCQPSLSEFALLDLAARGGEQDVNDPQAMVDTGAAFMSFLQDVIDPEDWHRFMTNAKKEKWSIEHDLLPLVKQVVEYMMALPTSPPSDSQPGLPKNGVTSRDDSYLPGGAPVAVPHRVVSFT